MFFFRCNCKCFILLLLQQNNNKSNPTKKEVHPGVLELRKYLSLLWRLCVCVFVHNYAFVFNTSAPRPSDNCFWVCLCIFLFFFVNIVYTRALTCCMKNSFRCSLLCPTVVCSLVGTEYWDEVFKCSF